MNFENYAKSGYGLDLDLLATPKQSIKYTFEENNVIVIQYDKSIILHKRRIESNEPLPIDKQPP